MTHEDARRFAVKIRTLALAALAIALSACSALAAGSWDIVRGNGSVRLESREVAAFTGIEVAGLGARAVHGRRRAPGDRRDRREHPPVHPDRGARRHARAERGARRLDQPHAPGVPDHRARPSIHRHRGLGRRPAGVADRRPTGSTCRSRARATSRETSPRTRCPSRSAARVP